VGVVCGTFARVGRSHVGYVISFFLYQASDIALYYLIGFTIYWSAYNDGEKVYIQDWQMEDVLEVDSNV
jgi:hypothetical protein